MTTPTTPPTAMDLINDISANHEIALALAALVGLIGGSIGYDGHREVALNVIERELVAATASMTALTEKIRHCLGEGE